MRWEMPQPCMGPLDRVFRTRTSRVPCRRSLRVGGIAAPLDSLQESLRRFRKKVFHLRRDFAAGIGFRRKSGGIMRKALVPGGAALLLSFCLLGAEPAGPVVVI